MATLNIRIDDEVKTGAQSDLDEIGLSMTGAISVYLKRIAKLRAIPFPLSANYTEPESFEPTDELAAIIEEVKGDIKHDRNLSPPIGRDELIPYLDKLRKNNTRKSKTCSGGAKRQLCYNVAKP